MSHKSNLSSIESRLDLPKIDMVNNPPHYASAKIEAIEVIEEFNLGFNLGNAVKYVLRCEKKGNKKQDLEKALWYINRELSKFNG